MRALKSLHVELSYKVSTAELKPASEPTKQVSNEWINMSQKAVRVPLTLEHVVGAQKGMLKFPSILTTPDKNVFLSMYPQPEFIFRH